VDFDHGLNNAVNRLRDALGDSAEAPRFVATLPRRGYRFIGQVQPPERTGSNGGISESNQAEQVAAVISESSEKSASGKRTRMRLAVAGIASLLLVWPALKFVQRHGARPDAQTPIRSIAVLPLENLSGDTDQDYFADGMTEQLITELGQIKALRVISHTSVNQYKATRKTVPVIARELQVDALVEGTVTRSHGRIRVTANLVQAFPEKHLWADTYERDLQDVLSLQGEVSQAIARSVRVQLTPDERDSFANRHPIDLEAHEAYLKGLFYFARGKDRLFVRNEGKQDLHKANDYFQKAIAIDPQYAQAYAGLGRSYIWLADAEGPEDYAGAKAASDKAISLDPTLAEPHMVRGGMLLTGDPDWAGAGREFLRSIELNPSYSEAHQAYAIYLSAQGRFNEATAEADRAVMLDPVSRSPKSQAAWIDVLAGRYDKAITRLQNITEMFPEDALSHGGLGTAYVLRGRFEEGIAELRRSAELCGKDPNRDQDVAWAYAMAGKPDQANQILSELTSRSKGDAEAEYGAAVVYAGLGEDDQAFVWLEKAYEDRHDALNELWREPAFAPLRLDPRFRQLLRKIGMVA
jgi:TolB-like protein/Flp pilus assembly protein TadD